MADFTLMIGYRNTSSWSLRGWMVMRKSGLAFEVEQFRYRHGDGKARLLAASPTGKVPVLIDRRGDKPLTVWESLSICEYAAEHAPGARLWPVAPDARALARSIAAEMHSGFVVLRDKLSMDLLARKLSAPLDDPALKADIARIETIWTECRTRHGKPAGGPFLFGAFTAADAMFAPLAARFRTYDVRLDPICQAYADTILADPDFRAWEEDARKEA
jgi:glutathione S-transferase